MTLILLTARGDKAYEIPVIHAETISALGSLKVDTKRKLYCLVHNIKEFAHYGSGQRI